MQTRCSGAAVPKLFGTETSFMEDSFSMGGWFQDDSSTFRLMCSLFLI